MNAAQLHDKFERISPKGIGVAIDLALVQSLADAAMVDLGKPMPGVNQQIPLPLSPNIQAGFDVGSGTFKIDKTNHTVDLDLNIYLHAIGKPTSRIVTLAYSLKQERLGVDIDQSSLLVSLVPTGTNVIAPASKTFDPNADQQLINAGYVTATGKADWDRFNSEVYYPFLWNVSQGLARSVIRSVPVPQPIAALGVIRPVVPLKVAFADDYLLAWSDLALATLPDCGQNPSPIPTPQGSWRLRAGSPPPSSPFDTARPPFAIYVAGDPILNWHSGVLKPAVMVSQSGGSIIGWRFDAAIGLDTLLVELVPAANGGSIVASAGFKVVGVASAWLNLPCGPASLVSASIQGDASATASLGVVLDNVSQTIDANFVVQGSIDPHSIVINLSGPFGAIIGDILGWLVHLGVINIGNQFSERGSTVLWDAGRMTSGASTFFAPRMRVGNASALIGIFKE